MAAAELDKPRVWAAIKELTKSVDIGNRLFGDAAYKTLVGIEGLAEAEEEARLPKGRRKARRLLEKLLFVASARDKRGLDKLIGETGLAAEAARKKAVQLQIARRKASRARLGAGKPRRPRK